jgi:hypothetical protein
MTTMEVESDQVPAPESTAPFQHPVLPQFHSRRLE